MPRTYSQDFARDDETPVTVEYSISGGCDAQTYGPAEDCYPAEAPEVEIVKAFNSAGPVTLTDAEDERFCQWLIENPPEDDDPADYHDWRE